MDIDLLQPASIDPVEHRELLDGIQGNILKGHGREHVRVLVLRFTGDPLRVKKWIRAFGRGWVTPASGQDLQARSWVDHAQDSLFANLFLTYSGYRYIDIPDAQIPDGPAFRAGMRGSRAKLNDPAYAPETARIDAMVLLALSKPADLDNQVRYLEESLAPIADVRPPQKGQALKQKSAQTGVANERYVEHLNYLDGRSQPLFYRKDLKSEAANGGSAVYKPCAHLGLVLVREPVRSDGQAGGFGSYLVYRKLEQDVRGFKERERKEGDTASPSLADQLGLVGNERKRVGAMVVGRFENGTPLALSSQDDLGNAPNDFNYDDDPSGAKCPLFAHIRKVNQRTEESRDHRIVRRGITYDDIGRARPPSDEGQTYEQMPTAGVGLLFMCFQSSIEKQFEYLQVSANDPDCPVQGTGTDPLAGQAGEAGPGPLRWPSRSGPGATLTARFGSFVRLKGGEYFFAPSRSFFEGLSIP